VRRHKPVCDVTNKPPVFLEPTAKPRPEPLLTM
jgi:hypothetical protein